MAQLLQLENGEPFGVGGRRECYVHPQDLSKCIKVLRKDDRRTVRLEKKKNAFTRFRREYNNNEDERRELSRVSRRIGEVMSEHLPLCYGYEMTDLGEGLVLDLVRDHDGPISRSVRELISTGFDLQQLKPAYDEFGEFMLKHRILSRGLHDHNLVAQSRADGSWRLFLIDGVGDPAWLPFADWFAAVGRKKVEKRLRAAWPRMVSFALSGGVDQELRANSTWDQGFLRHRGESDNFSVVSEITQDR